MGATLNCVSGERTGNELSGAATGDTVGSDVRTLNGFFVDCIIGAVGGDDKGVVGVNA